MQCDPDILAAEENRAGKSVCLEEQSEVNG